MWCPRHRQSQRGLQYASSEYLVRRLRVLRHSLSSTTLFLSLGLSRHGFSSPAQTLTRVPADLSQSLGPPLIPLESFLRLLIQIPWPAPWKRLAREGRRTPPMEAALRRSGQEVGNDFLASITFFFYISFFFSRFAWCCFIPWPPLSW